MICIDNIEIDDHALFGIAHTCDPERFGTQCTCCATYEVNVDEDEIPLLDGCIALAIAEGLVAPSCANPFEELDDGEYCIDTDDTGQCLFARTQPNGACHCALHTMALKRQLEPYKHKPRSCTLWPVAVSDDKQAIGITPDAFDFPCNKRRKGNPGRLHPGIAQIIDLIYSPAFRQKLEATRHESTPLDSRPNGNRDEQLTLAKGI
jgi:hypothetical protein